MNAVQKLIATDFIILFAMQESLNILEVLIRKRQHALWLKIVKEFEVEDRVNTQVQTWIREGIISERAYDRERRRRHLDAK